MKPRAFASPAAFRRWLSTHHDTTPVLLVRCFKVRAAHRGLTYRQALDEALCFGWIDGVRHALDEDSFCQRFTPRRPGSYWSAVNRRRAAALTAEGRMHEAGLVAFRRGAAAAATRDRYSFENRPARFSPELGRRLRDHAQARSFFDRQPPWYRRTTVFWVMSAKREETRLRRFEQLLACSAAGQRLPQLGGARARTP